jgi:hypothetical protein
MEEVVIEEVFEWNKVSVLYMVFICHLVVQSSNSPLGSANDPTCGTAEMIFGLRCSQAWLVWS